MRYKSVCPYCKEDVMKDFKPWFSSGSHSDRVTCKSCGKKYIECIDIKITFKSEKMEEENGTN